MPNPERPFRIRGEPSTGRNGHSKGSSRECGAFPYSCLRRNPMTFAGFKARIWKKLSCAPLPLFEVGPYLALGFLLEAFPPLQHLMASWHGDVIFGFLGGLSVITLVVPRGRMAGLPGWMKAWGLGLF